VLVSLSDRPAKLSRTVPGVIASSSSLVVSISRGESAATVVAAMPQLTNADP
jgi:hypothetical protein